MQAKAVRKAIAPIFFSVLGIILISSCGPSDEEKKKAEQKADSIRNQIMKEIEKEVEHKEDTANIKKKK